MEGRSRLQWYLYLGWESRRIDEVEVTGDSLTSRGGLVLFIRYLRTISLDPHLERLFGSIRKNRKGQPVTEILKSRPGGISS